jgi:formylglycine-generating enzyme required for sulfatase activity
VPLVVSALLVFLLIGGAIVWLSIRRKSERQTAVNQESVKRPVMPSNANLPSAVKNNIGMEMRLIPAGNFMMGSENGNSGEKPVHRVTINYSFYMGKYEVTQAQWQTVMGNNPSEFKGCDLCPVENVSWDDAQKFIRKLNAQNDGYTYRLPSEAEWEYACRAGTTGDYAGNLDSMAWYANNSGRSYIDADAISRTDSSNYHKRTTENDDQTHPVGQKQANAFGLYDMYGNVGEWCQDWSHVNYGGTPTDGSAWESKELFRVLRGGSWYSNANTLRPAFRSENIPGQPYRSGLRVVAVSRSS